MGSGKSTVGKVLSDRLEYRFFDTDSVIEQASSQSITEIFATLGESEFRALETQVLSELSAYTRLVIATGGGIVSQQKNWSHMRHGLIVWLNVPIDQLYRRLEGCTTRPLLQGDNPKEKLKFLLEQRQPLYSQADLCITVGATESPDDLASRILQQIPSVLKDSNLQNSNSETANSPLDRSTCTT